MSLEQIVEDILLEDHVDWIDFTDLRHFVGVEEGFEQGVQSLLKRAGEVAVYMVQRGMLIPGDPVGATSEFAPWDLPKEAAAARIEREVAAFLESGRKLYPGDIAWFDVATDAKRRDSGT